MMILIQFGDSMPVASLRKNDRIFNNDVGYVADLAEEVKVLLWRWFLTRIHIRPCLFYKWSWNPRDCLLRDMWHKERNEMKENNVTTWKVQKEETNELDVITGHCTKKRGNVWLEQKEKKKRMLIGIEKLGYKKVIKARGIT
ncbi:hypothetical protein MTR_5g099210 [Medicago truncatula]|uniref:Uncharacterized protein n=1 Tax=Medicago truncatula TaxID=3880 RepID=G7KFG4_MEDTR|nr:hypothetical protein MTR_5g099210 [Medicago truncatula]